MQYRAGRMGRRVTAGPFGQSLWCPSSYCICSGGAFYLYIAAGVVSFVRPSFNSSSKPKLACEIAADRVLAARVSDRGEMVETAPPEIAPKAAWSPTYWK